MQESGVGVKYTLQMRLPAYRRFALRVFAALALLSGARSLHADDGAASIAAGGIVMVREPRITMQKEVLRISASKVQVDYEFRNDTDKDITTEVAFPVPAYSLDWDERPVQYQGFEDFELTIEGKKTHFDVEIKAKLKGRDVSAVLKKYGIDLASFGHFDEESHFAKDVRRLSTSQRSALIHSGLLYPETDQDEGTWSVEKKYYWSQTFPAHAVVHISHQYTPVLGGSNSIGYGLSATGQVDPDMAKEVSSLCLGQELSKKLEGYSQRPDRMVPYTYVDFILTTANTWKTPIEDFTLIVEKPHSRRSLQTFVSFCWDGPVTKVDEDHFSTHTTNMIPKKELRVGFIDIEDRSAAK
jgi:hypothetical protein